MKFEVFAPATIGNVASGFDILGLAVDSLGDHFAIETGEDYSIEVSGRDHRGVPLDPLQNAVTIAAHAFYQLIEVKDQAFRVHIKRQLPLAGGLGSSAASSVAGAMAAAHITGLSEQRDFILRAALAAETVLAGPHLDNIAPCFLGGLALVQDVEQLAIYSIPMAGDFFIVLITPDLKIKTKDARMVLPAQLNTSQWTKQMAHCTTLALALSRGDFDQLPYGLTDTFAEPARAGLIPGFKEAKAAAKAAGAYGFSLSGSGPTCFAICQHAVQAREVARSLGQVFGRNAEVHIVKPRMQGAQIIP